jgi:hypothetical protein
MSEGVWYCTREDVARALDMHETARNNVSIDRAIAGGSISLEGLCHRKFYPVLATRYFDWPDLRRVRAWRLWLDENELISATQVMTGEQEIPSTGYFLEPVNSGPPYNRIEIDLADPYAWGGGDTHQRDIAITGLWGYWDRSEAAGTITDAIMTTSATTINVSNAAAMGVGSILRIDDERLIVTDRMMQDTTQNLGADLTGQMSGTTVTVASGAAFSVGEVILIDSEKMLIIDIAGNNLAVKRAWDGSTLAAHTSGADIYASRTLVVKRGQLGTTAATHLDNSPVTRWVPPPMVNQLAVAEAINILQQETTGYARVAGAGNATAREFTGRALEDLRDRTYTAYGRKSRKMAV